jgi:glyoxalase family protein
MNPVLGIHHITAVAGDPQANVDFYHNLLGQRLVKKTVNFDDPGTYHFYFGDEIGSPGTILTFFPWQQPRFSALRMARGRRGNGEVAATAYAISSSSVNYWRERLADHGVTVGEVLTRFGAEVIPFQDPDGMVIELIVHDGRATYRHWEQGPIPAEHALRGFFGATLWVGEAQGTADLLTGSLGFTFVGQEGSLSRFQAAADVFGTSSDGIGLAIDLLERPRMPFSRLGVGSVHHIAFRTASDEEQGEYLQALRAGGYHVSPVMDRQYFNSIYFRAPGGVLFEIATDAPGFLYDEPVDELGTHLKLPPWLEARRADIERAVPPFTLKKETETETEEKE